MPLERKSQKILINSYLLLLISVLILILLYMVLEPIYISHPLFSNLVLAVESGDLIHTLDIFNLYNVCNFVNCGIWYIPIITSAYFGLMLLLYRVCVFIFNLFI